MKCFLTFVMVLLTLTTCPALGFVDTDAPKEDPEFDKAISRGAKTKIELHVVDDEGVPVPKANVRVTLGMVTTVNIINGQTDTNGVFIIEGKTRGNEIIIQPKKEGYYNSEKTIIYWGNVNIKVKNGRWQPYGEKITIVLRKKHNPSSSLITDFYNTYFKKTKELNKWIGFDLEQNDYVEPYGNGKVSDFEIFIEWDGELDYSISTTGCVFNIRFTDQFGGFYAIDKALYSDFKGQYVANINNNYSQYIELGTKKNTEGEIKTDWFDKKKCWVVRSRCVVNEKGELISANYSTIYRFDLCREEDKSAGIRLIRVFNPKPNDINLEPANIPTSDGFSIENLIKRHGIIGAPEPIKRN